MINTTPQIRKRHYILAVLLPIFFLLTGLSFMAHEMKEEIVFNNNQLNGLNYLPEFNQLIVQLQRMRGIDQILAHTSDTEAEARRNQLETQFEQHWKKISANPSTRAFNIHELLDKTKQRLDRRLYTNFTDNSAKERFNWYTQRVSELNQIGYHVAVRSNILLDYSSSLYAIASIHSNHIPALAEALGQLRGAASGALSSDTVTKETTRWITLQIGMLNGQLSSMLTNWDIVLEDVPDLDYRLTWNMRQLVVNARRLSNKIARWKIGPITKIDYNSPTEFFDEITDIITQAYSFQDSLNQNLVSAIRARRDEHHVMLAKVYTAGIISFLLTLAFTAFFYITNMRGVRVIEDTNQRLKGVLNSADVAIIVLDKDGLVNMYSHGAERMLGYTPHEVIGRSPMQFHDSQQWFDRFNDPNDDADIHYAQNIHNYLQQTGHSDTGELVTWNFQTKFGDNTTVELSLTDLTNNDDQLIGHILLATDVSKHIEFENSLKRARLAAEESSRAKGMFLANMSHEIRTPMNAVINLSRLALDTHLAPKPRDYIEKVLSSGEHLLGIINDILDFSKIEEGKVELEKIPFSLQDMVADVADVVSHHHKEKVELLFDVPASTPYKLTGDVMRLRQVLINLVNNALKFTEEGEVSLIIEPRHQGDTSVQLDFHVCDTGIGMSPAQVENLFQAFQQADGSITRKFGGTGLGLAISQQLVGLMGGNISVSSREGEGSTFSFSLEFDCVHQEEIESLSHLRALVVDDNHSTRTIIQEMLHEFGISVNTCENGFEAIEALQRGCAEGKPFQLLLLDWKMPKMDGLETWEMIRNDETIKAKPRPIMMSAYSTRLEKRASQLGINTVLEKPVTPSSLFDSLNESRSRPAPLQPSNKSISNLVNIAGARVLLVEDNIINQQIATELLKNIHLQVVSVNNGKEALNTLAADDTFDIVLMDLQMPVMDGYQAAHAIRQQEKWNHLPVVAMTAHAMTEERDRCKSAGMNDYVTKPIDIDLFYGALVRWIKPRTTTHMAATEITAEISHLPTQLTGFDIEKGLSLLGGNASLFVKLLNTFSRTHNDDVVKLQTHIRSNRFDEAARIVHSIKGVSGNLGALELSLSAAELEAALKQGASDKIDFLQKQFESDFNRVMLSLSELRTTPTPHTALDSSVLNSNETQPLLNRFIDTLTSDLGEAKELLGTLRRQLHDSSHHETLMQLNAALSNYDIDKAATLAQEILDNLDRTPTTA